MAPNRNDLRRRADFPVISEGRYHYVGADGLGSQYH